MKQCPFCTEMIQDEAVKCRYCGEFFDKTAEQFKTTAVKWYFRTYTLVIAFLCVGPLMLPLIWVHPKYPVALKAGLTIAVVLLTWWLGVLVADAMRSIQQYYAPIFGGPLSY